MRKLFKLATGLALTGVAGYIVLAEGVAVVRAPIDGQLSLQPRVIGERVQRGQTLNSLTDVRAVGRTGKVVFSGTPRDLMRTVGSCLGLA